MGRGVKMQQNQRIKIIRINLSSLGGLESPTGYRQLNLRGENVKKLGGVLLTLVAGVALAGCACDFDAANEGLEQVKLQHARAAAHHRALIARAAALSKAQLSRQAGGEDEKRIEHECTAIHEIWRAHRRLDVSDQNFSDAHCSLTDRKAQSQ